MSNIFNTNIDNSIDSDETKSSTSVDSATSATPVTDSANAKANPEPSIVANLRWRVADIALGAALSAVFGVILCGYGLVFIPIIRTLNAAVLPGFASITHGVWYLSGTLALLLIRKPGSAVYVNTAEPGLRIKRTARVPDKYHTP